MRIKMIFWVTALVLTLMLVSVALAQMYQVERNVIGGGGEKVSASSAYTLNGTIGEPLAGDYVQNSSYQLTSGFWAGAQTEANSYYLPSIRKND